MAAVNPVTPRIFSYFLHYSSVPAASLTSRMTILQMRQLTLPLLPSLSLLIPAAIQLKIPTLLGGLWESVLRAVPKKKTSYMKKRSRFMAGKALKDVTSLNRCSSCGHIKKAHLLCPYCVKEIQSLFKSTIMRSLNRKTRTAASSPANSAARPAASS